MYPFVHKQLLFSHPIKEASLHSKRKPFQKTTTLVPFSCTWIIQELTQIIKLQVGLTYQDCKRERRGKSL